MHIYYQQISYFLYVLHHHGTLQNELFHSTTIITQGISYIYIYIYISTGSINYKLGSSHFTWLLLQQSSGYMYMDLQSQRQDLRILTQ